MATRQRKLAATDGSLVEQVEDAAKTTGKEVKHLLTVLWDNLQSWQQDNHYIYSGYRPASNSYTKSLASLGYLHNESVNIYTHLLGAIAFTISGISLCQALGARYGTASKADVLAFGCFFLGAALCLGMSATYHTLSNHSSRVHAIGNKLDYVGIVFLITGSFVPCIYYGFYCEPGLQKIYWTMVHQSISLDILTTANQSTQISSIGLGCAVVSIVPKFRTPQWRPFRATIFVLMGLSAVFPVVHGVRLYGILQMRAQMGLSWVVLQGFLYILGASLYAVSASVR